MGFNSGFKGLKHSQHYLSHIHLTDNKIMEQVNSLNYLRNISYEKELGIDNKLHNCLKITGILTFKNRASYI